MAGHLQISTLRLITRMQDASPGAVGWVSPGPALSFPFFGKARVSRALSADMRKDDAASLEEVRNRLQFLADTGYDLRHNLPS